MEKENEILDVVLELKKQGSRLIPLRSSDQLIFPDHGFMVIELIGLGSVPYFRRNNGNLRLLVNNQPLAAGVQKYIAEYGEKGDQLFITNVDVDTVLFTDNLQVGLSPDSPTAQASGASIGWPTDTSGEFQTGSVSAAAASAPAALGSDTTLVDELTIVVPSTNSGTIYVGNSTNQPIPLTPPANGLLGITIKQVKLANIYFSASNTTDKVIYFYGGA